MRTFCFWMATIALHPRHLQCMAGKLMANSSLDAVYCGWQRVPPSGAPWPCTLQLSLEVILFKYFAWHGYLPIHSCVLKRELALAVGAFDPSLSTCEDWDFFQRVARAGARFGRVKKALAYYHIRPGSASQNNRRYLSDAFLVVGRGYGSDPRVPTAAGAQEGRLSLPRDLAFYYQVIYNAAKEIGAGRDALDFLDTEGLQTAPRLSAAVVANLILETLSIGANRSGSGLASYPLWSSVSAPLAAFLAARVPNCAHGLAFNTLQYLKKTSPLD